MTAATKPSLFQRGPALPDWMSRGTRRPAAVIAAVVVAILGAYFVVTSLASGTATLSLSPSGSTVALGSTFTVAIYENSGTDAVNAVQSNLTCQTATLQVVSIDCSTSAFGTQAQSTTSSGTITIARGATTAVTGKQIVGVVTFKAVGIGAATAGFGCTYDASSCPNGNAILRSSDNTNILGTQTGSNFTVADQTAPSIPSGLSVAAHTVTTIGLSWTASTDNVSVTGYNVYRDGTKIATAAGTTYTDSGLTPNTTYTYTVAAYDAAANTSSQSPGTVAKTDADTSAPTVPGKPTQSSRTMNSMNISWTASTDNVGVTGYKVYRNGTQIATATSTAFSDSGLAPGTTYTYTVAAYDATGNTSAQSSGAALATAPDAVAPSIPGGLTTNSVTSTSVSLSWTASTDNVGVTGYKVYRGGTQIATTAGTSYNDSGLTAVTAYSYQVTAFDAAGNESAKSSVATATTTSNGDLNGDGHVNIFDLSIFLNHWMETGTGLSEDFNGDNIVNIFDLSILLNNYGS